MRNLFNDLPSNLSEELVTVLAENQHIRIERIVSTGQSNPKDFWYDQDEHEWMVVLKGEAMLVFDDGESVRMRPGDHVLISAHKKYRVELITPAAEIPLSTTLGRDIELRCSVPPPPLKPLGISLPFFGL